MLAGTRLVLFLLLEVPLLIRRFEPDFSPVPDDVPLTGIFVQLVLGQVNQLLQVQVYTPQTVSQYLQTTPFPLSLSLSHTASLSLRVCMCVSLSAAKATQGRKVYERRENK